MYYIAETEKSFEQSATDLKPAVKRHGTEFATKWLLQ